MPALLSGAVVDLITIGAANSQRYYNNYPIYKIYIFTYVIPRILEQKFQWLLSWL
jgi:hypothetical protein